MDERQMMDGQQMMDGRQAMRASDADRQEVVDRLRAAVGDGRLRMDEYEDRMGRAYQATSSVTAPTGAR